MDSRDGQNFARRNFLKLLGAAAAGGGMSFVSVCRATSAPAGSTAAPAPGAEPFAAPEKVGLVLQTDRPPNLEMPLRYFREDLTPNEAFYVRWHLAVIPTRVDEAAFRLTLGGHVQAPLSLSLDQLRRDFKPVSVVAVNQCSGNSRSFFRPRVPGVQWGNGAIGNARWTGVRLADLLARAKVRENPVDVSFNGLDGPVLPAAPNFAGTPDFVKSLPFDRANDGEVMVAYEMNGKPLPMLNGFPLRLVVPGWYATYWVKALSEITVLDKPFDGFWMAKAYRVPDTSGFQESPAALAKKTVPIGRMTVRSLFVKPGPDEQVEAGTPYEIEGLALDGGKGIQKVEVSTDGGGSWAVARLDRDLGNYSWRRWRFTWRAAPGRHVLMARATNRAGEGQATSQWNRSGYARNVIESLEVTAG